MFSGIIEALGRVEAFERRGGEAVLTVAGGLDPAGLVIGRYPEGVHIDEPSLRRLIAAIPPLAGVPVLAVRGQDGAVRAFHNVCRHRGMLLCDPENDEPSGSTVRCPYHGWEWSIEGDLVRVIECRPLSRQKRWRLVEILERAR